MESRNIITNLLLSLEDYLDDPTILYELYRTPPVNLESRNDIPRARIALYEIAEQVSVRVDASRANLSQQRYGIDISVLRAYKMDKASKGELPLLDLRDSIVTWASTVDAGAISENSIYTFGYDGNSGIIRNDRYVSMTMVFTSLRNLHVEVVDNTVYLLDYLGNQLTDYNNNNLTP
jgi:hypothetical protein